MLKGKTKKKKRERKKNAKPKDNAGIRNTLRYDTSFVIIRQGI